MHRAVAEFDRPDARVRHMIFLVMAVLFVGMSAVNQAKAQDPMCPTLRTQLEEAEKLYTQITGRKVATDEFITLAYEPATDALIDEEMEFTNTAITKVNGTIIAGDKSPDTRDELLLLRNRLEMLKLKKLGKLSLADPRLEEQTKALKALLRAEEQQKVKVTDIQKELIKRKCPAAKTGGDDLTITREIDDGKTTMGISSAGIWKYVTKDGKIFLKLSGSGSSTTGSLSFDYGEKSVPSYNIYNCRENAENRLACDFSTKGEDYEKTVEMKGTVGLTLTPDSIVSSWKESGSPTVTWKPAAKTREYVPRAARSFNITFTR